MGPINRSLLGCGPVQIETWEVEGALFDIYTLRVATHAMYTWANIDGEVFLNPDDIIWEFDW